MNEVEIELNAQELAAIHNIANELDCSPNYALSIMLENYLLTNQGAKKQPDNLTEIYSKLSELFGELAGQAA